LRIGGPGPNDRGHAASKIHHSGDQRSDAALPPAPGLNTESNGTRRAGGLQNKNVSTTWFVGSLILPGRNGRLLRVRRNKHEVGEMVAFEMHPCSKGGWEKALSSNWTVAPKFLFAVSLLGLAQLKEVDTCRNEMMGLGCRCLDICGHQSGCGRGLNRDFKYLNIQGSTRIDYRRLCLRAFDHYPSSATVLNHNPNASNVSLFLAS
jgi:hypothetical protein